MTETIELKLTFSHHKVGEPLPKMEEYIVMLDSCSGAAFSTGNCYWNDSKREHLDLDAFGYVDRGSDFWYAELPETEYPTEDEPEDDSDRAYEERRGRRLE